MIEDINWCTHCTHVHVEELTYTLCDNTGECTGLPAYHLVKKLCHRLYIFIWQWCRFRQLREEVNHRDNVLISFLSLGSRPMMSILVCKARMYNKNHTYTERKCIMPSSVTNLGMIHTWFQTLDFTDMGWREAACFRNLTSFVCWHVSQCWT